MEEMLQLTALPKRFDFDQEGKGLLRTRLQFAIKYMAIPLVLGFSFIDMFFRPDLVRSFFLIRLSLIPVALGIYFLLNTIKFGKYRPEIPALVLCLYLGIINTSFVFLSGFENSIYYGGLNLVGVGALFFLPWNPRQLILVASAIYLPYLFLLISRIIFFGNDVNLSFAVPHLGFVISTIFLGSMATIEFYNLRKKENKYRQDFNLLIRKKDQLIETKTQEGIKLERLAIQFSPQVVSAIKHNQISLDRLGRKEISVMFIDIQNSTGRSLKVDQYQYTEVIKDFFSRVVEILLNNNITVGTYLGDGLLAMANTPQDNANHEYVCVQAALCILKEHKRLQQYYLDRWRNEFNVRIGINSGFCAVGLFPNEKHGTYTALGQPVNLASRLCSLGNTNEICVTKNFLLKMGQKISPEALTDMSITMMGLEENIKGFEGEQIELFSIALKNKDFEEINYGQCAFCQSDLKQKAIFTDSLFIHCTNCGYSDIRALPSATAS